MQAVHWCSTVRPYLKGGGAWQPPGGQGNSLGRAGQGATAGHFDHVHLTFKPGASPNDAAITGVPPGAGGTGLSGGPFAAGGALTAGAGNVAGGSGAGTLSGQDGKDGKDGDKGLVAPSTTPSISTRPATSPSTMPSTGPTFWPKPSTGPTFWPKTNTRTHPQWAANWGTHWPVRHPWAATRPKPNCVVASKPPHGRARPRVLVAPRGFLARADG